MYSNRSDLKEVGDSPAEVDGVFNSGNKGLIHILKNKYNEIIENIKELRDLCIENKNINTF